MSVHLSNMKMPPFPAASIFRCSRTMNGPKSAQYTGKREKKRPKSAVWRSSPQSFPTSSRSSKTSKHRKPYFVGGEACAVKQLQPLLIYWEYPSTVSVVVSEHIGDGLSIF